MQSQGSDTLYYQPYTLDLKKKKYKVYNASSPADTSTYCETVIL